MKIVQISQSYPPMINGAAIMHADKERRSMVWSRLFTSMSNFTAKLRCHFTIRQKWFLANKIGREKVPKGVMTMNEKQTPIDWRFWRRWVLFNTVGYGMGGVAGFIGGFIAGFTIVGLIAQCFYSLGLLIPGTYMDPGIVLVAIGTAMVLGGAMAGASIGLALWEALRLKTPGIRQATWMKVHIVGMAISWIIFAAIMSINPEETSPAVADHHE